MKILINTPYLNILGGGEQYLLNFADCMAKKHQVTFVWKDPKVILQAAKRFNIKADFRILPFLPARLNLKHYDILFFVSDGSIPFLPFSKSILLFMSPFTQSNSKSLPVQAKLKFINHVVCFSKYTKQFIDKAFKVNSKLIYPAIEIPQIKTKKQNIILSVGRFSSSLHVKNQDVLAKTFIEIKDQLPGWRLILAGGTETGSLPILKKLKKISQGQPIAIKPNISHQELYKLYSQAKIYWHAAGYNADLNKHPEKAEHFGITIVEAMGQKAIPVVFNAGGPQEIVKPNFGFSWQNLNQLKKITLDLVHDNKVREKMATRTLKRAQFFNKSRFCQKFYELVKA